MPDLVLFDCDGVLVDSERLTVGVEARVLTALGWPMTAEEVVSRWMGRSSAAQLLEIADRLGAEAASTYDELSTRDVHAAFDQHLRAVAGVETVLDHLDREGVATCVASSGTPDRIRRTLRITGLWDRFEGRVFSAVEVPQGKPAPDLFLHAASGMAVRPSRCAVVEDSVYGVRAAVAAGMPAYGYAGGLTSGADLAAAGATTFEEMRDLVPWPTHSSSSSA
ncbi:MAG: HAD-IA family hydrolase [Nocardioidaceae bacterium]|nr:HAD-IA family hydrolase [Nocardioidaceae bacterium]